MVARFIPGGGIGGKLALAAIAAVCIVLFQVMAESSGRAKERSDIQAQESMHAAHVLKAQRHQYKTLETLQADNRAKLAVLAERIDNLQRWADHMDALQVGEVIEMPKIDGDFIFRDTYGVEEEK